MGAFPMKIKKYLWLLMLALFTFISIPTRAQNDPLNPAYKPTINTNPADYPSNIWITDTMQKVQQHSGSPGAVHWGTFYGTQNEFVDFQVHVQANSGSISNMSVTASNFVNLRTGTTISAASTDIVVYREAYIDVTTKTSVANTYYNSVGYYPDILIPTVDPYYHQTTNAWPFTVASGKNQSAWIDILIPPTAPSGYYLGSITVKSGDTTLTTMPIIIAVWQWPDAGYMPSTATLRSFTQGGWNAACTQFYGGYSSCGAYPGAGGNPDQGVTLSVVDEAVLMLDHRYSNAGPIYPPYSTVFAGLETYFGPLFNGTTANTQTILHDAKLKSAPYAPAVLSYVQNWMAEFQSEDWLSLIFDYSCDEPPNGCAWATINKNAATLHAATPPMSALVTTNIANATANGVLDSIDWMVPIINDMDPQGGSLQRSTYDTWLSGSSGPTRQLWSYQSCESSGTCTKGFVGPSTATWPNYDVDGVPAANRAMEWLTFLHGQSGELYYDTDYCWGAGNCTGSDPWVSVYYAGGNGDGTLVYPGTNAKIGVTDPIFLPSIRLKHIRDGMQDYEYLNALKNADKGSLVAAQINSWITNSYTFETTGTGLQAARQKLGTALHDFTYPPPLITISASRTSVSVGQGSNGTSTITTAVLDGFDSAIALSAKGQPTGVTVTFNPTSIAAPGSGSSTMNMAVASTTATGTYTITVTGAGGGVTQMTTVALTVTAPATFTIGASPTAITVARGKSGTFTITTAALNGFVSAITLSATGQGSDQTVTFSPNPIAAPGSGSSTMMVMVGTNASLGLYTITITGTGGGKTHTTALALTVTAAATPTFTISGSRTSVSVGQGSNGTSTITTAVLDGFDSAITLTAKGQPTSVTVTFNPTSIAAPGSGSSTMNMAVASTTATGTYTITVTGAGGGVTQMTTVALTVTACGPTSC